MNINATEEINRELGEIEAKIKQLESSPNRAFELIEYDTLSLFHWFNLCFKQFWDEFDRHSAGQLLSYQKIVKTYSDLSNRYVSLLKEQIDYLESVVDIDNKCFEYLPPVIFSEDNTTDVIGYYKDCFKDEKDEDGKPLYCIDLDKETASEIINGKSVPVDLYMFRNDKLNDGCYKSLFGLHSCLKGIYDLMCVLSSYPDQLLSDNSPNQKDVVNAIDKGLRQYAKEIGRRVERELRKTAQSLKTSRNAPLTPDVWGLVMQEEDDLFDLAINGKLEENTEKRFEYIFETQRKQWTENYPLLQKIKTTCLDGELFDIRLAVDTHQLLSSLNADNLDLFYELVLRRNIIQREMFPDELGAKYAEWANPREEQNQEESENAGLSDVRQSRLDEIVGILKKGNWKQPATADNIELLLNAVFGKDMSMLNEEDIDKCEKMWALVEGGGGDRMVIVPANLAGFFSEENLITGSPKEISTTLFRNGSQVNNINKGNSNRCSETFKGVIPFLKKYIDKIVRQV